MKNQISEREMNTLRLMAKGYITELPREDVSLAARRAIELLSEQNEKPLDPDSYAESDHIDEWLYRAG